MKKLSSDKISFALILIVVICTTISCNQIKFEKDKWNYRTDPAFPSSYRPRMLSDLTTNHKLVGLHYSKLIDFLGKPDIKENNVIIYQIIIDYNGDIDPVFTKNLEFVYSKDSLITSTKIIEWRR